MSTMGTRKGLAACWASFSESVMLSIRERARASRSFPQTSIWAGVALLEADFAVDGGRVEDHDHSQQCGHRGRQPDESSRDPTRKTFELHGGFWFVTAQAEKFRQQRA